MQPVPGSLSLDILKSHIIEGRIKIPQFQREFVWDKEKAANLLDSILKGFPIGTFIMWRTKERLRSVKNIGNIQLPDTNDNDSIFYILDGQQRITSIFACITGEIINNQNYSEIYVRLDLPEEETFVVTNVEGINEIDYISLKDLVENDAYTIANKYMPKKENFEKITKLNKALAGYQFSKIEIIDASIDVATDIFTRINVTGKPLSLFEIMCAKSYDEKSNFDLYSKREEQLDNWSNVGYETVADSVVLQAIAGCLKKNCSKKAILNISKTEFIANWDNISKAFDNTIDYFRNYYGIVVSKLLPYDALLVPFVYYFYKHNKRPEPEHAKYLQDYFWRCVLTNHFTEGVAAKLATDITNVIDVILNNGQPKYEKGVDITPKVIQQKGEFTMGSAYVKGLLCILSSMHPKSFKDGIDVIIDNNWLSQSNSKNYHHFFPKAYMKKNQQLIEEKLVNHIANITIVDDHTNKNEIKDKAPSVYMKDYAQNPNIKEIMKTHLIDDLDEYEIWENNYNKFFENRIKKFCEILKTKLILTSNDTF